MIGVRGGVGLRVLRAVALAVQPDFFIAHRLAEKFEVFHSLVGAEIRKGLGVAHFRDALVSECPRRFNESRFPVRCGRVPVGTVKLRGRGRALQDFTP